ncbi:MULTISPECIES: retropepsin-like aspartic protease family protein [Methylomonas]|nr:retropepsin-like aspartic protease [Methylomonas koyamae]
MINNVPMPFLLDTGATRTVIPIAMAIKASLPFGDIVLSNTAGGKVADRSTQIASLALGNAVLRNLDAQINEHLDEVLIGMNTLKYFQMTQTGNTLTLVVNNPADPGIETPP